NGIYNDYLTVQQTLQGKLLRFPMNWTTYFVEIHRAVLKAANEGVNMSSEKAAWTAALEQQPRSVQRAVYERLAVERPLWIQNAHATLKQVRRRTGLLEVEGAVRTFVRTLRGKPDNGMKGRFATLLEYVEWADAQAGTTEPVPA